MPTDIDKLIARVEKAAKLGEKAVERPWFQNHLCLPWEVIGFGPDDGKLSILVRCSRGPDADGDLQNVPDAKFIAAACNLDLHAIAAALAEISALRAERDQLLAASNDDQYIIDLLRVERDRLAAAAAFTAHLRAICEYSVRHYSLGGQKLNSEPWLSMIAAKRILRDMGDFAEAARAKGAKP